MDDQKIRNLLKKEDLDHSQKCVGYVGPPKIPGPFEIC